MKVKMALLSVMAVASMVVTLLALSADGISKASPDGEVGQVDIDASYNGQGIEIDACKSLVITLASNPATGFRWELAGPIDENLLALIETRYEPGADAEVGLVGAGGTEVWTFETLTDGETTITMEYSRPWDGGEKAVKTFEVTVIT